MSDSAISALVATSKLLKMYAMSRKNQPKQTNQFNRSDPYSLNDLQKFKEKHKILRGFYEYIINVINPILLEDIEENNRNIQTIIDNESVDTIYFDTGDWCVTDEASRIFDDLKKTTDTKIPISENEFERSIANIRTPAPSPDHQNDKKMDFNGQYIVQLGDAKVQVPYCDNLMEAPNGFFYLINDMNQNPGLYYGICQNVFVAVPPDMDVVPSTMEWATTHTKPCTKNHVPGDSDCTFVHVGGEYAILENDSACPSCPAFGTTKHLADDISKVDINSLKRVLHTSLCRLLAAQVWLGKYKSGLRVISDIQYRTDEPEKDVMVDRSVFYQME
jgi:hypothetical protein